MNAPTKFGQTTTMSAREFNQHTSQAKKAAERGPVFITDRGKPGYVLLTDEEYRRLAGKKTFVSIAESLADPNAKPDDPDLMDFIPKREIEPMRFSFDEDDEE